MSTTTEKELQQHPTGTEVPSTSTGEKEAVGPSKKELKKMAKKSEKKMKKSEAAAEVEQTPTVNNKNSSTVEVQEEEAGIKVYVPAICEESEALKAAIGCTLLLNNNDKNIKLQVTSVVPPCSNTFSSSTPILVVKKTPQVIIYGGNAILTYLSPSNLNPTVDEWLEWEQHVLKNASGSTAATTAALQYLEQALSQGGDTNTVLKHRQEPMSVADVVIISTLTTTLLPKILTAGIHVPPSVQHYMDCHASVVSSAKQTLLHQQPSYLWNPEDPSLDRAVEATFADAIRTAFSSLSEKDLVSILKVQKCTSVKNGQYQCNSAMPIFAFLKATTTTTWKSPHEVAKAIIDAIPCDHPIIDASRLTVTGPGFILCHLTPSYLQAWVNKLLVAAIPPIHVQKQTIVVDFSSPNIAKGKNSVTSRLSFLVLLSVANPFLLIYFFRFYVTRFLRNACRTFTFDNYR